MQKVASLSSRLSMVEVVTSDQPPRAFAKVP